ncbi:MAG: hypothetical protein MUC36_27525 [Planctomycetes bacterium]|jgi:hypothetical protein|nr:hypothetical protein [Planctomycetota bacterium]
MHKFLSMLALLLVTNGCSGAPDTKPLDPAEVRRLYASIRGGSPRSEVEAVLGQPVAEWPDTLLQGREDGRWHACYLMPPPISEEEAPYMFGAIKVTYDAGRVVEKQINPQVR